MESHGSSLLKRTVGCGTVTDDDAGAGREVVLTGWVHRRRDLGGLIFIEVRDATGRVQVVFDPSDDAALHARSVELGREFVIRVEGSSSSTSRTAFHTAASSPSVSA